MLVEPDNAKTEPWIQMDLSKCAQVYPEAQGALQRLQERKRKDYPTEKVKIIIFKFEFDQLYQKKLKLHSKRVEFKVHLKAKCNKKNVPNGAIGTADIRIIY